MKSWVRTLGFLGKKPAEEQLSEEFTVRSKALDITNRLFADFGAHYYGDSTPKNNGSRTPNDWQHDGLIETSIGYYRPFVDTRNGNVVLLNAYNVGSLIPKKNEHGQWRLSEERGVYVVNVLKGEQTPAKIHEIRALGSKGPELRRLMLEHHNEIRNANYNHLNLYAADLTQADCDGGRRVIKLTNGELAYGIFETEDNQWMVRLYVANEKLETHDIDQFMRIEERPPKGFLGRTFSLGQGNDKFSTLEDAYKFVFEDWSKFTPTPGQKDTPMSRAYRIWTGQSPLRFVDKRRYPIDHMFRYTYASAKAIDKFKSHRPVVAAALVAGSQAIPVLRTGRVIATGVAAISAAGAAMVDMFFEEGLLKLWKKADRWKTKLMAKVSQKVADEELPHTYMVDTAQNLNRWCSKIDPSVLEHLRPLSQHEANMQYDNQAYTGYSMINDFDYWLATVQNRLYASVFTPLSKNMVSAKGPNGLVALFHLSDDGHTRTSYVGYSPEDDIGSALLIPAKNLEKLKRGGIYKTVHRKGEGLRGSEDLSIREFFEQAHILSRYETRNDDVLTHQHMNHVHGLFNGVSDTEHGQSAEAQASLAVEPKQPVPVDVPVVSVEGPAELVQDGSDLEVAL
jgi:AraC-like DNA-binding protein